MKSSKPNRNHSQTAKCERVLAQIGAAALSHSTRAKPNPEHTLYALNDLAIWHSNIEDFMQLYVKQARKEGQSWAMIGEAMGMTKGSAHQRFGRDPRLAAAEQS